VTHLVDTSVWHQYGRSQEVQRAVDKMVSTGALLTTCPPVVAEYCCSARTASELDDLQGDMALLYTLESDSLLPRVKEIQAALWSTGRVRAAGSQDTLIAAYSLSHDQTLVTLDVDFLHISRAVAESQASQQLRVIRIAADGSLHSAP
jgi:predicted nucleic acid-binding protein